MGERVRQTLQWIGPGRLLTGIGVAAVAAVGGWWLLHAPPPPVERSLPVASPTATSGPTTTVSVAPTPSTGGWLVVRLGSGGLDVDHGSYPYVTSSNTGPDGVSAGTGLPPRALDRVLRSQFYWVAGWFKPHHWIAYWDMFGHPSDKPRYSRGIPDTWWYDRDKAARIERG